MIDLPNQLSILPMAVLVIFLFADEMWQQVYSEEIPRQLVKINQFLTPTTIEVGSDLTIPCSVEGYPIPTVSWYKDGQIIRNNIRRQVIDNQLIFFHTNVSDSGSYTCFAYNSFSSDSQTVMVTIQDIVRRDEDKNINVKVILWIALVQLIFLLLVCCLIHLLINQRRKDEKLKELMNLHPKLVHPTKTI